MKTVIICDTEPVAIEGLSALLAATDLRVIAAETCLASGMDAVQELQPALMVLDKAFGLNAVLEAVRLLARSGLDTRVVVWSAVATESEMLRLMRAGALGVVRKTAPLPTLLECIQAASEGAAWMEDAARPEPAPTHIHSPLTSREAQVRELVERGLTNKEIAVELGIRSGTVKIHLKHIFEKTGIHGRYGLALRSMKDKGLLLAPAAVM